MTQLLRSGALGVRRLNDMSGDTKSSQRATRKGTCGDMLRGHTEECLRNELRIV